MLKKMTLGAHSLTLVSNPCPNRFHALAHFFAIVSDVPDDLSNPFAAEPKLSAYVSEFSFLYPDRMTNPRVADYSICIRRTFTFSVIHFDHSMDSEAPSSINNDATRRSSARS